MRYSLFVDESGGFGREDREDEDWILGGLLSPIGREETEQKIAHRLRPIPSEYGLEGRGDLHRTELNKRAVSSSSDWDFGRIQGLTQRLFEATQKVLPRDSQFLAVRNPEQRGLSDSEQTYRMMLLDLIGLADSVLPADENIDRLQLCIATRTDRAGRMTTEEELEEAYDEIVGAAEVGLASRGLVDLLSRRHTKLQQQKRSWALTVADFWCNAIYNAEYSESQEPVAEIVNRGNGRIFTTWNDDLPVRRALVAERDGSFGLALCRWSMIRKSDGQSSGTQMEAMERLCKRIIATSPRKPRPTFEVVIEMLWRRFGETEKYDKFISALQRVASALKSVASRMPSVSVAPVIFRMRNMVHLAANRDGKTDLALEISEDQKEVEQKIAQDPENFALTLDSQLARIHTLHHALDFGSGLQEAEKHRERVQMYGELWELLDEDGQSGGESSTLDNGFKGSRMSLKADMTWIISRVYAADPDAPLGQVQMRIETLKDTEMPEHDYRRLLNYSILARLKCGWYDGALDEALKALQEPLDPYVAAYSVRAAATSALKDKDSYCEEATQIYKTVREWLPDDQIGSFYGLAWRDVSLLYALLEEDDQAARNALRRGRGALTWSEQDLTTPIRNWIWWMFDTTGRFLAEGNDMEAEVPSQFGALLHGVGKLQGREGMILAHRVTPY